MLETDVVVRRRFRISSARRDAVIQIIMNQADPASVS